MRYYGGVFNRDTWKDGGAGADPGTIFDNDRLDDQTEGRVGPVVVASTEVDALGNTAVAADTDWREGVEPGALPNPAMVADFEVPGVLDIDRRLKHHTLADFGAEEAEGEGFEARGGVEGVLEEEGVGEVPEEAGYKAAAWIVPTIVECREIDLHPALSLFSFSMLSRFV